MTDQRDWTKQTALLAGPSVPVTLIGYVPNSTGYDHLLVAAPGAGKFIRFWTLEAVLVIPSGIPADCGMTWQLYANLSAPMNQGRISPAHQVDPRLWAGGLDGPVNTDIRFSVTTDGWADGRFEVSATYTVIGG